MDTEESLTNESSDLQSIPTLQGARNQSGYDKPIPLVLGKHLLTPYYCGSPYHTIIGEDGEEEYYNALYMLGYNDIQVTDIKLGQLDLASNSEKKENGNLTIDGRYKSDSYDITLELQQSDEVSLYPQKVIEESLGIELIHINDSKSTDNILQVNRFSAKYPHIVELEFTINGLIGYNDSGEQQEKSIKLGIDVSFDGGKTYEYFATPTCYDKSKSEITSCKWSKGDSEDIKIGTETVNVKGTAKITRKKNKVMRFVARRTFTLAEVKKIINNGGYAEFRIIRMNASDTASNTSDTISLSAIRTWCFDKTKTLESNAIVKQIPVNEAKRQITARLGFQIKAKENELENQIDSLNCILTSKGRTWNGTEWSSEISPTNNPASLILMVLQHTSRGKYKYSDSRFNLEKLGELYEWCNQERVNSDNSKSSKFTCNGILVSQKKTRDIINSILETCRAKLIIDEDSKYSVWIDKPQEYPVMILNNQNILSASNSKSFDELPNGYKIKFVNALNGYQSDERKVCFNDEDEDNPDATFESIEMLFCTDEAQVYQNGKWLLASAKLRPEVWNRKVSIDGNLLEIGSKVAIQDDTISVGIGDGAEIKEIVLKDDYIVGIVTDGKFIVDDESQSYGVMITQTLSVYEKPIIIKKQVKIKEQGEYSAFTFTEPISLNESQLPCEGDILSFGIFDRITTEALVTSKKDNGDGTFNLTLTPYQEGIYTADSGTIPEFDSKVTNISESSTATYEVKTATVEDVLTTINDTSKGLVPSQYFLDLSPEYQSIPVDSEGNINEQFFYISAYLYYKDILEENVTYKALIDGNEVGNWTDNQCKISLSYLKGDKLDILIKATNKDGYTRYDTATISKIYAGENGDITLYKMLFENGEKIKVSTDGNYEPSNISVNKRKVSTYGETNTDYGRIEVEYFPTDIKKEYNKFDKISDSETFDSTQIYYEKFEPVLISFGDDEVLAVDSENVALFFERV